jgi:DNA-directed RNA polymerase subunit D
MTVYSGELNPENPDITPISDKIPIVKLAPEQRVNLEAYARLGKGVKHAKWQPVSMCTYVYLPEVKIDYKGCDACGRCVKVCPEEVFVKTDSGIKTQNELECTLCMDCVDACPKDPKPVEITWEETAFIFKIESTGALPVERIVTEAVKILDKKIDGFSDQLKKVMKK